MRGFSQAKSYVILCELYVHPLWYYISEGSAYHIVLVLIYMLQL